MREIAIERWRRGEAISDEVRDDDMVWNASGVQYWKRTCCKRGRNSTTEPGQPCRSTIGMAKGLLEKRVRKWTVYKSWSWSSSVILIVY